MTPEQADRVLDALIAGFPRHGLDAAGRITWSDAIRDSSADFDRAQETAYRWPRTHEWFPSLAEFLTVVAPRLRCVSDEPEDPDKWLPAPDVGRRMIAELRVALAKKQHPSGRGLDGHWHGGPDPCPTCGGMNPKLRRVK